jgi:hypothetical protein
MKYIIITLLTPKGENAYEKLFKIGKDNKIIQNLGSSVKKDNVITITIKNEIFATLIVLDHLIIEAMLKYGAALGTDYDMRID